VKLAVEGLVPERLLAAHAPPGQLPEETWLVLQKSARTESSGSVQEALKVIASPAVTGSGASETDETVGARFCTVNVPESEEEQDPAASQAKA
jgi:hypothetical protein